MLSVSAFGPVLENNPRCGSGLLDYQNIRLSQYEKSSKMVRHQGRLHWDGLSECLPLSVLDKAQFVDYWFLVRRPHELSAIEFIAIFIHFIYSLIIFA